MTTPPSKTMAALWMAGWLSLTLVMAVAGREAVCPIEPRFLGHFVVVGEHEAPVADGV